MIRSSAKGADGGMGSLEPREEGKRDLERQLAAAQQIAHLGSWEWDLRSDRVVWSDELYRIYGLEPQSCPITYESFLNRVHPDDRAHVRSRVAAAMERGGGFAYPERIVRPDGSMRFLESAGEVTCDPDGRVAGLIGTCRDVTEERRERALREGERRVLEMIASGGPLAETLTQLVLLIEDHSPPVIGSILLLDETATRVRHGAGPHLPEAYRAAIDGGAIGPTAGSCGAAAFLGQPVFVEDIDESPAWADYRALAHAHGLRACWSTPIFATHGGVLGTFAFYYREPRAPTEADRDLIARVTHIAGIAIERHQMEEQLRALSAREEAIREDERTGIAREIHDEFGQALTAMKMDLAWVGRHLGGSNGLSEADLRDKLAETSQLVDEVIGQVRRISSELRPGVLDDFGLFAAIQWQAHEFERRSGTACILQSNLGDARLDRELSTALFRIFQEALTNVARHAEARRVEVRLDRRDGALELEVRDDGNGVAADAVFSPKSLGLLGIRERARRLGGSAIVSPAPLSGTTVLVRVPAENGAAPQGAP
jgi:PAS domain S-box-containing protein